MISRRAATRDPGPGTRDHLLQCLHLDQRLLQQQNAKRPSGTENYYVQLAQIIDKIGQRWKKTQLTFLKSQEQKQSTTHTRGTPHPKGREDHLRYPSGGPWTHPTLSPGKEPARPLPPATEACCLFLPAQLLRGPHNALPGFLLWLLLNSYWLRSPRAPVSNSTITSTHTRLSPSLPRTDTSRLSSGLRPAPDAHRDRPSGTRGCISYEKICQRCIRLKKKQS